MTDPVNDDPVVVEFRGEAARALRRLAFQSAKTPRAVAREAVSSHVFIQGELWKNGEFLLRHGEQVQKITFPFDPPSVVPSLAARTWHLMVRTTAFYAFIVLGWTVVLTAAGGIVHILLGRDFSAAIADFVVLQSYTGTALCILMCLWLLLMGRRDLRKQQRQSP